MLEAFQASKDAPAPTATTSTVRAKKASSSEDPPLEAGGPFAAEPHESDEAPSIELSVEALVMHQRLRWFLMAAGATLCFGLGYWLGSPRQVVREIVREVQAAEPPASSDSLVESPGEQPKGTSQDQRGDSAPKANASGPNPGPNPGPNGSNAGPSSQAGEEPPSHPILDSKNRYTILVATYDASEANLDRAWDLSDYLVTLGFDAIATQKDDQYFVVVSGSPKSATLDNVVARIRELPGPPPRSKAREFSDAYALPISTIIDS